YGFLAVTAADRFIQFSLISEYKKALSFSTPFAQELRDMGRKSSHHCEPGRAAKVAWSWAQSTISATQPCAGGRGRGFQFRCSVCAANGDLTRGVLRRTRTSSGNSPRIASRNNFFSIHQGSGGRRNRNSRTRRSRNGARRSNDTPTQAASSSSRTL